MTDGFEKLGSQALRSVTVEDAIFYQIQALWSRVSGDFLTKLGSHISVKNFSSFWNTVSVSVAVDGVPFLRVQCPWQLRMSRWDSYCRSISRFISSSFSGSSLAWDRLAGFDIVMHVSALLIADFIRADLVIEAGEIV